MKYNILVKLTSVLSVFQIQRLYSGNVTNVLWSFLTSEVFSSQYYVLLKLFKTDLQHKTTYHSITLSCMSPSFFIILFNVDEWPNKKLQKKNASQVLQPHKNIRFFIFIFYLSRGGPGMWSYFTCTYLTYKQ